MRGAGGWGAAGDSRTCWVQLRVGDEALSSPSRIICPLGCPVFDVDAVKEAAKSKFAERLGGIDAADLDVMDGEGGEALRAGQAVADLKCGKDEEHPLLLHAPKSVASVWVQLVGLDGARSDPARVSAPSQRAVFDVDFVKKQVNKEVFSADLKGVAQSKLHVFDGEEGEVLKAGTLVKELQAGGDEANPLLVKAPVFLEPVEITVWSDKPDNGLEDSVERFASEKEFLGFVAGSKLRHKEILEDGTFKTRSTIKSLPEAVNASKVQDTFLYTGYTLDKRVQDLENTDDNRAEGLEQQTTRAIVRDESIRREFGDVCLVNNGASVVFRKAGHKDKFLECDGLVKNTDTLILNEAKAKPVKDHVDALVGKPDKVLGKVDKLKMVLEAPGNYSSTPVDAIDEIEGLKNVVPVLSGYLFEQVIQQSAREHSIRCILPDGTGYSMSQ
uniref:Uncharacterized protein n=1 Tax=Hemiselmis tepida TaxID=464990 RepID=A0A7S0YR23_9CRYP|mmetsp:Transcript_14947/g.38018  ORF Transcript_14947/g.38018 Transcript_14947/m.38018 type:complete len:443 (+) Transcript_14947:2-1330(+)